MSKYEKHPLAQACRAVDEQSHAEDWNAVMATMEMDGDALIYVADQRALRVTILTSRGPMGLEVMQLSGSVVLTPQEKETHKRLMLVAMDCMAIGWRGRQIQENEA